jgi:hypothetical protein
MQTEKGGVLLPFAPMVPIARGPAAVLAIGGEPSGSPRPTARLLAHVCAMSRRLDRGEDGYFASEMRALLATAQCLAGPAYGARTELLEAALGHAQADVLTTRCEVLALVALAVELSI